jgi:hypothetical protein
MTSPFLSSSAESSGAFLLCRARQMAGSAPQTKALRFLKSFNHLVGS